MFRPKYERAGYSSLNIERRSYSAPRILLFVPCCSGSTTSSPDTGEKWIIFVSPLPSTVGFGVPRLASWPVGIWLATLPCPVPVPSTVLPSAPTSPVRLDCLRLLLILCFSFTDSKSAATPSFNTKSGSNVNF